MNKQETIETIEKMPTFELIKVAVARDSDTDWEEQKDDRSVVEVGTRKALCYTSKRYVLTQFKDIFIPAIEPLPEFDAKICWYEGMAIMDVFPEEVQQLGANYKYGISVINSVDKTSGIVVKFNVLFRDEVLRFPKNISRLYVTHSNKEGLRINKDYFQLIHKVKDIWSSIVNGFPQIKVTMSDVDAMNETFNLGDDLKETLKGMVSRSNDVNVWSVVMMKFTDIAQGKRKSDVHRAKAFDELTEKIYAYALASKLM